MHKQTAKEKLRKEIKTKSQGDHQEWLSLRLCLVLLVYTDNMNSGKQPLDNGDRIAREYKQHTVHTRPAYYPHSSPSPFYRLQAMGLKPCVALREMVIAEPSASVGRQGRGMDTLKDEMFLAVYEGLLVAGIASPKQEDDMRATL